MKIKKTIETADGGVTFEGELNSAELDVIIAVGLNYLYQQGAIPFKEVPEGKEASFGELTETEH